MKLAVLLTILSYGVAMADILPENQNEGKEVPLVRLPRRYRFRVSFRRRYATPKPDAEYSVGDNPYGIAMGNRRISTGTSTTTPAVGGGGETTVGSDALRGEGVTMPEVREDAIIAMVGEDATMSAFREDATLPAVRDDVTEPPIGTNALVADVLPNDWKRTDNGEFKFHKEAATWGDAREICTVEGGFLAVLNSDAQKQDLLNFLKDPQDVTGADASWMYYLGYTGASGEYQIMPNGAPVSATGYSPWCAGSPATTAEQKCGVLDTTCTGLIDISCSLKLAFFCSRF